MKAPRLPSFFKSLNLKPFSFKPRYYDERREKREESTKGIKSSIKFNRSQTNKREKESSVRIILLIIVLSLLAYKFIIN